MPEAVVKTQADPLQKLDEAVIAPKPTRRYRARAFQAYVLIASVVFVALAVVAHSVAYFPIDLTITRALQAYHGSAFGGLMYGLSWLGFMPQVDVLAVLAIAALFIAGLRWESVVALFSAGSVGVGTLVKLVVYRPRPSADLVRVFHDLPSSGFPSGHVLEFTAFGGFLAFLAYTLLKPSWGRSALLAGSALLILLMGVSRIYQGQHWFSDVMGAYLLGSLWLALTIRIYRWGKPRFFASQPVAPDTPAAPAAPATPAHVT
jgi:membrane-associated phospholipid phosphatase